MIGLSKDCDRLVIHLVGYFGFGFWQHLSLCVLEVQLSEVIRMIMDGENKEIFVKKFARKFVKVLWHFLKHWYVNFFIICLCQSF